MPIAVLTAYTEKEYESFDPYSRFCTAMPVSVCFSDTAICTLSKLPSVFCFMLYFQERAANKRRLPQSDSRQMSSSEMIVERISLHAFSSA